MLVVAMVIIVLTTATATFALQGSTIEVQAAGGMKRNMVVRTAAESLVMAGAALIDAVTNAGIATTPPDVCLAGMAPVDPTRARGVDQTNFAAAANRRAPEVLTEAEQRDDIGAPASGAPTSSSTCNYRTVMETWPRSDTSPGASASPTRIVWTTVADCVPPGDVFTPGEAQCRSWHQLVTVSTAYFDAN